MTIAAACQREGFEHADTATQQRVYLALLESAGPLTDWDAAARLGLLRSTINARRNELVKRGLVGAVDKVRNHVTGVTNTRWGVIRDGWLF